LNQIVDFVNHQLIHVSNDALTNFIWPLHSWQKNWHQKIIIVNSLGLSVSQWRWASTGGLGMGEVQVHPQQVQASSGWMVDRWVLNHSGPLWSDGNWCSSIQWMDGALVGAKSFWPSVIRWKSMFNSNWKNIKNRRGEGGSTIVWKEKFF